MKYLIPLFACVIAALVGLVAFSGEEVEAERLPDGRFTWHAASEIVQVKTEDLICGVIQRSNRHHVWWTALSCVLLPPEEPMIDEEADT